MKTLIATESQRQFFLFDTIFFNDINYKGNDIRVYPVTVSHGLLS